MHAEKRRNKPHPQIKSKEDHLLYCIGQGSSFPLSKSKVQRQHFNAHSFRAIRTSMATAAAVFVKNCINSNKIPEVTRN